MRPDDVAASTAASPRTWGAVPRPWWPRGPVHLGELTAVLAARYGRRPAVEEPSSTPGLDHGPVIDFAELEDAVARLAAVHRARGRRERERVLIVVDNRLDVALHTFALARLGAVPVPVNARLAVGELAAVVAATGARAAVADPELATTLPETLEMVTTDIVADALADDSERREAPVPGRDPNATAVLLTTSGTSGAPKAAALTSRGLLVAFASLGIAPVGATRGPRAGRDLAFAALPLTHVMGLAVLIATLCAGVPLLRRRRFDAVEALELIETRRPNLAVGVPTMYADLEAAGAAHRDLSSVQVWASAADVMPTARARRFQGYGAITRLGGRALGRAAFVDVYGMVELSGAGAVRMLPPSLGPALPAPSFAVALPGVEVRAVDERGRQQRAGVIGQLQWRGAGVLRGYVGPSSEGPDDEGWFSSGDQGRVWRGGVLRFAGRDRDRCKVGGFSVFPAEVEEELRDGAPGIVDLAVAGVDDERLGQRLVAVVVPTNGFDAATFLGWAHGRVAGYRRPTAVVEVEVIPRGNHGKIDRDAVSELADSAAPAAEPSFARAGPDDVGLTR